MRNLYNRYNRAYKLGQEALSSKNLVQAREYFKEAEKDHSFHEKAILGLINVELNGAFYGKTRALLEENREIDDGAYHFLYGDLEIAEFNYSAAIKHYEEAFKDYRTFEKSILRLERAYMNLGEYDRAIDMCNYYFKIKNIRLSISMDKIYLYILLGKYDKAYEIFSNIPYEIVLKKQKEKHYQTLKILLEYLTQNKTILPEDIDAKISYIASMIIDYDRARLVDHVKKHLCENDKGLPVFNSELDVCNMLDEAEERMKKLNPSNLYFVSSRIVKLDSNISPTDGGTDAVMVKSFINSDNIFTSYPVFPSKNFNEEGTLEDKKLKFKRKVNPKRS